MPILPTSRLVSQIQRVSQDSFYGDLGYLLISVNTGTYDEYNNPVIESVYVEISCSFSDKVVSERWLDYGDVEEIVAEVRFAGSEPKKGNTFKISRRYGSDVGEETFEICGVKNRGLAGWVCALKKVQI